MPGIHSAEDDTSKPEPQEKERRRLTFFQCPFPFVCGLFFCEVSSDKERAERQPCRRCGARLQTASPDMQKETFCQIRQNRDAPRRKTHPEKEKTLTDTAIRVRGVLCKHIAVGTVVERHQTPLPPSAPYCGRLIGMSRNLAK